MKLRTIFPVLLLGAAGCLSTQGFNPMSNQSQAMLDGADYRVEASGLRGEASVAYLFGLFPLGDPNIATRAMDALVASAQLDGRPRALVNFAFDQSEGWYFVITTYTTKIRADLVEFNQ